MGTLMPTKSNFITRTTPASRSTITKGLSKRPPIKRTTKTQNAEKLCFGYYISSIVFFFSLVLLFYFIMSHIFVAIVNRSLRKSKLPTFSYSGIVFWSLLLLILKVWLCVFVTMTVCTYKYTYTSVFGR